MSSMPWSERTSYLLAAVGAHTQMRFAELVAPMGLLPHHVGVLRHLADSEGSTQQDIADALRVRRGVMVGLVDELEAKGLVQRRRHPLDRRANALMLTAAGKRTLARVAKASDSLDDELIAAVPAQARADFRACLHRLGVAVGVADGVYPTYSRDSPAENRSA
jgi:DNA-binding MarR family transcriptional regulator